MDDLRAMLAGRASRAGVAALWEATGRLSLSDLKRFFLEAVTSGSTDWREHEIACVLIERIVEKDRAAAVALFAELEGDQQQHWLQQMAGEVAASDPAAAMAALVGITDPELRKRTALEIIRTLAESDPLAAAAMLRQLAPEDAAVALKGLLPRLAQADPKAALEIFRTLGEQDRAGIPLEAFLGNLAVGDLEIAKEFLALTSAQNRNKALAVIAGSLSVDDPARALTFLQSLGDADIAGGLGDWNALGRLGAHDPEETAKLMGRLPVTNDAWWKFARVAETWVEQDPAGALGWVRSIEAEGLRSQTLTALYRAWAIKDRGEAMTALGEIDDPAFRRHVFSEIATEIAKQDPNGAAEWARELEGEDRSAALGLLAGRLASSDPVLGARYLTEALEQGAAASAVTESSLVKPSDAIGHAFAQRDPVAASQWAMTFPDGPIQQHVAEGVARAWTSADPAAASEWIGTLPSGGTRNGAIFFLVQGIRGADPSSAFRWASSVEGEPDKRLDLLKQATDSWSGFAPAEARAAIEALSVSASDREALLMRIRP